MMRAARSSSLSASVPCRSTLATVPVGLSPEGAVPKVSTSPASLVPAMPASVARTLIVPDGEPPDVVTLALSTTYGVPSLKDMRVPAGMANVDALPDVTVTDRRAVKPDRRAMPSTKAWRANASALAVSGRMSSAVCSACASMPSICTAKADAMRYASLPAEVCNVSPRAA